MKLLAVHDTSSAKRQKNRRKKLAFSQTKQKIAYYHIPNRRRIFHHSPVLTEIQKNCSCFRRSIYQWLIFRSQNNSGTPPRPKAAGVEPHTHTKRRAGNFLWSWQAEWFGGACAVRTYVAFLDFLM